MSIFPPGKRSRDSNAGIAVRKLLVAKEVSGGRIVGEFGWPLAAFGGMEEDADYLAL